MITLSIDKKDQRFRDRWRWNTVARKWATEAGMQMTRAVKERAPIGKKEGSHGQLRDSISHRTSVGATTASIEVYSTAPYVGYVIHGTSPHVIVPRNAKVLHWVENDTHFYRLRVNHPGAKANNFPEKALRLVAPSINQKLAVRVREALEE